jgi:hypothetical protein
MDDPTGRDTAVIGTLTVAIITITIIQAGMMTGTMIGTTGDMSADTMTIEAGSGNAPGPEGPGA